MMCRANKGDVGGTGTVTAQAVSGMGAGPLCALHPDQSRQREGGALVAENTQTGQSSRVAFATHSTPIRQGTLHSELSC